jgi:hypothetical protein
MASLAGVPFRVGVGIAIRTAIGVAIGCAAFAEPAFAQEVAAADNTDEATRLFQSAKDHFDNDRHAVACPLFLQSYELDPTKIGVLYALAECYAKIGRVASAALRYEEYLRAVEALPPGKIAKHGDRIKRATMQREALASDVPEVTLVLSTSAPLGTRVTLDGEALGEGSLGAPRKIDPGEHRVAGQAGDGASADQLFSIGKGEKKTIVIEIQPKAPRATPPSPMRREGASSFDRGAPQASGTSGWRIGSYTAFSVGGASLALGVVTGIIALGRRDAVKSGCPTPLPNGDIQCSSPESAAFANSTKTLGTVSTVGFSVAAFGAAAGLGLLLLAPSESPQPKPRQSWSGVAVESAGAGHAMVRIRGSF